MDPHRRLPPPPRSDRAKRTPLYAPKPEDAVREELRHHEEMLAEKLQETTGMGAAGAAREARRRLHVEHLARTLVGLTGRRRMTMRMMDAVQDWIQDVRIGLRTLRRRPTYALSVLGALGIGIGGAAVTLSLLDAIFVRPLPVPELQRVVSVYETSSGSNTPFALAYASFEEYRAGLGPVADLAAARPLEVGIARGGTIVETDAAAVSWNYFRVLGLRPQMGRFLVPSDEASGAEPAVVLGDDLWRSRFGADPSVVGSTILLGDLPTTVIGIAPRDFRGTRLDRDEQAWFVPHMLRDVTIGLYANPNALETRFLAIFDAIARLPEGVDSEVLVERLASIRSRFEPAPQDEVVPEALPAGVPTHSTRPLAEVALGSDDERLRGFLSVIAGLSLFTLLVGTLNAMQLRFAHTGALRPDLGVRRALGASPMRLVRQLLADGVFLVVGGTVLGLALSQLVLVALTRFTLPGGVSLDRLPVGVDLSLVLMLSAISAVVVLGAGLVPAWRGAREDPAHALRRRRRVGESALIGAQVALSTGLVLSAALFLRSFVVGLNTDLGLEPDGLVALTFSPAAHRQEEVETLAERVFDAVRESGIAEEVALAAHVPVQPWRQRFKPVALGEPTPEEEPQVQFNVVLGPLASVMGIPILEGRDLDRDLDAGQRNAVLNRSAAELMFPGKSAVGRFLKIFPFEQDSIRVVGVVEDARSVEVTGAAPPFAYVDVRNYAYISFSGQGHVVVRPRGDQPQALAELQRTLSEAVPEVPFLDPRRVSDQVVRVMMPQHLGALLFGIFGLFAALLAACGVGGVVSFELTRRRREIAIRSALGADWTASVRPAVHRSAVWTGLGLLAGVALMAMAAGPLQGFLLDVDLLDPLAIVLAVVFLGGVTALAAGLVLRRTALDSPAAVLAGGEAARV